jgi:hypothetical protein
VDAETREFFETLQRELRDLRRDVDARFDAVDQRFDAVDQRFDGVDQRFDGVDQRFASIDQRFEEQRRHVGVLIEEVRHDLRAVAEMVVANTEAITDLRARVDARPGSAR